MGKESLNSAAPKVGPTWILGKFSALNRAKKTIEEGGGSVSNLAFVPLSQIEREKESIEMRGDKEGA